MLLRSTSTALSPSSALRRLSIRTPVPIARASQLPLAQKLTTFHTAARHSHEAHPTRSPQTGLTTPAPKPPSPPPSPAIPPAHPRFTFSAAYAAWPKRPSRPFPPPFFSKPSGSFSDPLSNSRASRVAGEVMLGVTNGDDAVVVREDFVAVLDGVGAWAMKERGCAGLWSRLVGHFWAREVLLGVEEGKGEVVGPVEALERALGRTKGVLEGEGGWLGTTTASSALLRGGGEEEAEVWVTQLGDCKILVLRAGAGEEGGGVLFSSKEQWHYFDCPRQLGTNSPDTPLENAVLDVVPVVADDIVLALSDGVTDNLWEHEIASCVFKALEEWEKKGKGKEEGGEQQGMKFAARELVLAARAIAEDPFAESPFMEKAVEEGLAVEGGKRDDISVVVAKVVRGKGREDG